MKDIEKQIELKKLEIRVLELELEIEKQKNLAPYLTMPINMPWAAPYAPSWPWTNPYQPIITWGNDYQYQWDGGTYTGGKPRSNYSVPAIGSASFSVAAE